MVQLGIEVLKHKECWCKCTVDFWEQNTRYATSTNSGPLLNIGIITLMVPASSIYDLIIVIADFTTNRI